MVVGKEKKRRCSMCGSVKHDIRTCPKKEEPAAEAKKKRCCSHCGSEDHDVRSCTRKKVDDGDLIPIKDFVLRAIKKLRRRPTDDGIHVVFSDFNEAFRSYYPGLNPVEETKRLADEEVITLFPAKGGAIIKPFDGKKKKKRESQSNPGREVLKKLGLA